MQVKICFRMFRSYHLILTTATTAIGASITLNWQDNSANEDGFRIERKAGLSAYDQHAVVGINTTSFEDNPITPGMRYCHRVIAFNAAGSSAPTNEACITVTPAVTVEARISLNFDGTLRDRVGQNGSALASDGISDGTFTVGLDPASGARTVSSLAITRSGGGSWDTQPQTSSWVVGAAYFLDGELLNDTDGSVYFQLTAGDSFKIFAGDVLSSLFSPGHTFTLTVGFADGDTAKAAMIILASQ